MSWRALALRKGPRRSRRLGKRNALVEAGAYGGAIPGQDSDDAEEKTKKNQTGGKSSFTFRMIGRRLDGFKLEGALGLLHGWQVGLMWSCADERRFPTYVVDVVWSRSVVLQHVLWACIRWY